jgi:hypothetical protein
LPTRAAAPPPILLLARFQAAAEARQCLKHTFAALKLRDGARGQVARQQFVVSTRELALLRRVPPAALRHAVEPGITHGRWVTRLAQVGEEGGIVIDVVAVVVVADIIAIGGNGGICS